METVHKWGTFEAEFNSHIDYADPFRDVALKCTSRAPSGRELTIEAFWDGGSTWRVRFMPEELGTWTYETECSSKQDEGLHNQTGRFESRPYKGENPLYLHGPLSLSANRRYLVHSDGLPFFWLADTAWNGVIRSTLDEWEEYLNLRREQGFTAIQFVSTHWRGGPQDAEGEKAYEGKTEISKINPDFFRRIDPRFAMVNEHCLVAAPVLLWAFKDDISPGDTLAEEDAVLLARYLTARYGAYILVWILGGDGDYTGEYAGRWKNIGRTVFSDKNRQLVAMHPRGRQWILPEFLHEDWLDIIGYQSGHRADTDTLRWLCLGPPSKYRQLEPSRPMINLEPNYEAHLAYGTGNPITPQQVRRAAYLSLLIAPTAGVSYGTNGVWYWTRKPEVPVNHPRIGVAKPWREVINLPGAEDMSRLKKFFSQIPWWTLHPRFELLTEQPGLGDLESFVAASRSQDGKTAVFYTPVGQTLHLDLAGLKRPPKLTWVNPRSGEKTTAEQVITDRLDSDPPGPGDWILLLESSRPTNRTNT